VVQEGLDRPLLRRARVYASKPPVRLAVAVISFAVITFVTYLIAHPRMFTGFASYDDEGYMLTALKGFVRHGALYDDVFTQYGPFYYEAWGGLFSLFGIAVTHDAGRTLTMIVWVLSSLVLGVSAMRMTGSLVLGLMTQLLVFTAIGTLTNEPMHPGGIICLLLAAIVAISCGVRERFSPGAFSLLGAAIAALILVKINVGGFALAAVTLASALTYPALSERRWLRPIVEMGFVAIPVVLMAGKFGEAWARHYAAHVAIAALAVVIVLRARSTAKRPNEELVWMLGGLILVGLAVCLAIVGAGTSVGGLIDGVIRQPLRQADAFTIPLQLSNQTHFLDLIALGGAVGYWYGARGQRQPQTGEGWHAAIAVLSLLVGVEIALSVIGKALPFEATAAPGYPLSLLAFAWVALIPVQGEASGTASFARLLLPLLAVLQVLHAFPVAGSQTLWSAFLLVPVGAICIGNGARGLARRVTGRRERRGLALAGFATAAVLVAFVVNTTLREPLHDSRAAYDALVPLDLPGTSVRLNPSEVSLYKRVTAAIDANCSSFVMLPGMDSFYLWTEQEPPTGYTATGWPTLFDDAHQRRVISNTRSIRGLCLLRNIPLAEGWSAGKIPPGPLVRYLNRGFRPLVKIGDYELLKRSGPVAARL
jgi:hypothetical protein